MMQAPLIYPDAPYWKTDRFIDNDLLPYTHIITAHSFLDVFLGNGAGAQRTHVPGFHFSVIAWTTLQTTGEMGWTVPLAAGTWTAQWFTGKRNDYGITQFRVDGVQSGATQDLYVNNAAHQPQVFLRAGLVLAAGEHTFTMKQNGTKNAASTAYLQVISGLALTRTA